MRRFIVTPELRIDPHQVYEWQEEAKHSKQKYQLA
jgi:hypothetical protein